MSKVQSHSGRVFAGLVLIVVGGLFLLDQLGEFDFGTMISRYWPVIFFLIGISILISNGFRRIGSAVFFFLLGGVFLAMEFDLLGEDIWNYIWPAAIILVGLWLLVRPAFRHLEGGAERIPGIKDSDVDIVGMFSGQKRRIESSAFRGGRATALFGGAELDLTGATLAEGKATLELTAIFGGIDLRVPRDWRLVVEAVPILGGVDDKRSPVAEADVKATLYVKATAIFGGIDIKN
jgi:predicted membrane protein